MAVEGESSFDPQAAHGLKGCAIDQAQFTMIALNDGFECLGMVFFVDPIDHYKIQDIPLQLLYRIQAGPFLKNSNTL
jgi:hypothetical protein